MNSNKLGGFDVTMIVISLVVGMGIFGTPARVAASAGSQTVFFATWIAGGLIALCGALTYAEVGLRLPVIGAYYKVFAECYHPGVGFTVNTLILVSNAASLAVVALIGADYVSDLLFGHPSGVLFNTSISIAAVTLFFLVNLMGLKTSSRTQNFMIVIKIGLVLLLIGSIFKGVMVEPHGYEEGTQYSFKDNNWLKLFLISMVPVCFSYGGYQQTINFGSEVQRSSLLPRGIISGMIIVTILYLLLNYAYVRVVGFESMKNVTAIGALLCEAWFGKTGGKIFDALMFLSVLAYVNILLMSNPRVMYAMSTDRVLPASFAYRSPKTGALVTGLLTFSAIAVIVTFFGKKVDNILGFTMFLDSIGMSTSAATIYFLRKKHYNDLQANASWNRITPVLAAIFVLAYLGIAVAVIIDKPGAAVTGVILLAALALIYFLFYHKKAVR